MTTDYLPLGTNFPAELYDGHLFGKESYYEELARAQKEEMDRQGFLFNIKILVLFFTGGKRRRRLEGRREITGRGSQQW